MASILLLLLGLELGLRFFPVSMSLLPQPMNASNPIRRFEPNRTVCWSQFPDFSMQRNLRINNYGFINSFDYYPGDSKPMVAVIGDSYIEARQVSNSETIHGRIANAMKDRYRVYSFGSTGTPLSEPLSIKRQGRNQGLKNDK